MNRLLRPLLTIVLVAGWMWIGVSFSLSDKADGNQFLNNLTTIVGMVIAFWFGERSALKKPGKAED